MKSNLKAILLKNMQEIMCDIRGKFIGNFTNLEAIMDDVIFNNTDKGTNIFRLQDGKIPMKEKERLFNLCIDKYEPQQPQLFADLKVNLGLLIEIRNKLAHWKLDATDEGLEYYIDNLAIRLFRIVEGDKEEHNGIKYSKEYENFNNDIILDHLNALSHTINLAIAVQNGLTKNRNGN